MTDSDLAQAPTKAAMGTDLGSLARVSIGILGLATITPREERGPEQRGYR